MTLPILLSAALLAVPVQAPAPHPGTTKKPPAAAATPTGAAPDATAGVPPAPAATGPSASAVAPAAATGPSATAVAPAAGTGAPVASSAPAAATRPSATAGKPAAKTSAPAGLHCTGDPAASARAGRTPVLLIHGTTSNAKANFSWNWDRAFDAEHRAHCDVDLPDSGNGDIQVAAERVVRGIRYLHRAAGARIDLLGHSQGGMIGRWALKYHPDTRAMVDDYVSLAASNHGTREFAVQCAAQTVCSAAYWQQRAGSAFLTALNEGPQTWPGVDYTQIYTRYDEIIVPYRLSALPAAPNVTNVAVQELCPLETVEHFGLAYDNAAWLLGIDAIRHPGPARLSRVSRATCGRPLMPAVNVFLFPSNSAAALAQSTRSMLTTPQLPDEPALRHP
ncbi:esterase/lipase family protein [Actinoplanes siamensis]|uniref:esterase/lipase family protein n=1 Tax=Actinoplanes siamensis TaxID=1223317 RepID=UPI001EF2EFE2|nr:alpha/beta fold hydrolase [Actinoplanes siamensis]